MRCYLYFHYDGFKDDRVWLEAYNALERKDIHGWEVTLPDTTPEFLVAIEPLGRFHSLTDDEGIHLIFENIYN